MELGEAVDLGREAVMLTLALGLPMLAAALVVGVAAGVLQAVTQVQEHTLSFVPRIVAVLMVAVAAGPWALTRLVEFGRQMLGSLP